MAAGLIPMIAALGSAVDIGRIYIVKSQMQAGVDAAALAAANAYDNQSETDVNGRYQQAVLYYKDNVPPGYMGVTTGPAGAYSTSQTMQKPTFTLVGGVSRTVVNASGNLPMTFMRIFGMGDYAVSATATAEFQPHPLEVMVVLDNTGSMNDQINGVAKIDSLKTAMHSFIKILFQGSESQPELAMGIINYTITANVGQILKDAGIKIADVPGFTDRNWANGDPLGWKGCVADDETVNTMVDSTSTLEANAYDIWPNLPGEKPKDSSPHAMLPINPFFYPPMVSPKSASSSVDKTDPSSDYYKEGGGANTNLYPSLKTDTDKAAASALANTVAYKRYLYRLYKNINRPGNNVIVTASNHSVRYDPNAAGAYDDTTNTGDINAFFVDVTKIPNTDTMFKPAVHYDVTSNYTNQPSPNWQCPEPGLGIAYNRSKTTYDDFVNAHVFPVRPANGTMHHIGFLWGWRLLARYLDFPRTSPTGATKPKRALVFMTDGNTEFQSLGNEPTARILTAYGSPSEHLITPANSTNWNDYAAAAKTRFTKACAIANSTKIADTNEAPKIFTVAINNNSIGADDSKRLRDCGTAGYYLTTSPAALNDAFTQIARTLTDVHLTQ